MNFEVMLSAASSKAVAVSYATADGTATSPADYASASSGLNFQPGETRQDRDGCDTRR